ncbi:MAG: helix-turn-helix transcriptional regulator [Alphaproteobacteria bacterium]|nr:helix-turn-helix transcriptional regulator [Alphaproteobacteria bacterium]NCQ87637.1 helix-turn-helix transcriptional regulator [Alphaproteobacteria bacterium]NCT05854.1 helix-turn-helix transcriptional regulator [Alphaproteobacteria bacterium]
MNYDIIHIAGKPHVLVPLHDYTALKNEGKNNTLPGEVLQELALEKKSPIKIIRTYRGMTQDDLARATDISRPYLTEIETGRKDGSIKTLKSIANALGVPLEMLA